MTFSLQVDRDGFDRNARKLIDDFTTAGADVTAVVKGNGYGLGRDLLANESKRLGLRRIAVGTIHELAQALDEFDGEVVVLEPFNPFDGESFHAWVRTLGIESSRVIAVVAHDFFREARDAGIARVMVEGRTSMNRFGLGVGGVISLMNADHHGLEVVGLTLHFPIRTHVSPIAEIARWFDGLDSTLRQHGIREFALSHVSVDDITALRDMIGGDYRLSVRVGTALWLGASSALVAHGTVLEIHDAFAQSDRIGYRQMPLVRGSRLLVVSGGTAHGVSLAASSFHGGLRRKLAFASDALSEILGKARSPFRLGGRNLMFAEPPHMHHSLVWCSDPSVIVGDELECVIRKTVASFDLIAFCEGK